MRSFPGNKELRSVTSKLPENESDDRFARQNRFGPSPEFPLASSYLGIVHFRVPEYNATSARLHATGMGLCYTI
uniref:Uncharacterized protein n=1 Tax=Brugia malayi TaxID=6279 RepID=A8QG14_BRUMA